MRFKYRRVAVPRAIASLGGQTFRMRPLVTASLIGPKRTAARLCLLDPGSDDTVFTEATAHFVGIDLTQAPSGEMAGIGGRPHVLRYAQVKLRLTDGIEYHEWPAWVGFAALPLGRQILGIAGCLQFFTATFKGDREEVELTINAKYPGT